MGSPNLQISLVFLALQIHHSLLPLGLQHKGQHLGNHQHLPPLHLRLVNHPSLDRVRINPSPSLSHRPLGSRNRQLHLLLGSLLRRRHSDKRNLLLRRLSVNHSQPPHQHSGRIRHQRSGSPNKPLLLVNLVRHRPLVSPRLLRLPHLVNLRRRQRLASPSLQRRRRLDNQLLHRYLLSDSQLLQRRQPLANLHPPPRSANPSQAQRLRLVSLSLQAQHLVNLKQRRRQHSGSHLKPQLSVNHLSPQCSVNLRKLQHSVSHNHPKHRRLVSQDQFNPYLVHPPKLQHSLHSLIPRYLVKPHLLPRHREQPHRYEARKTTPSLHCFHRTTRIYCRGRLCKLSKRMNLNGGRFLISCHLLS